MGLGLAEPGFHTRCFVEWEEYPRRSIIAAQRAGYFAPAPIWDDLTTFDAQPFAGAIDTVLAGYPCQPFSQAGKRLGADDERHLWPDVARVIREIQPRWVFLENVAGHVTLGAETVLRELWEMGYTPAVGLFSAAETGAPHERLRWFCVAYRDSQDWRTDSGKPNAGADGRNVIGWGCGEALADCRDGPASLPSGAGLHPPAPGDLAAWADALAVAPYLAPAAGLDDCLAWARNLAAAMEVPDQEAAQSALCRMADGLALRSRALRLLGNGVHPLAAAHAWRSLAVAHGLWPVDLEA